MWDKIKDHVERHKVKYACAVSVVVGAGITYLIMRRNDSLGDYAHSQREDELMHIGSPQVNISSSSLHDSFNTTTTNNYGDVKPLSKIVADLENDRWWISQADAARELGVSDVNISRHLNHSEPLPGPNKDLQLTRMGVAA